MRRNDDIRNSVDGRRNLDRNIFKEAPVSKEKCRASALLSFSTISYPTVISPGKRGGECDCTTQVQIYHSCLSHHIRRLFFPQDGLAVTGITPTRINCLTLTPAFPRLDAPRLVILCKCKQLCYIQ